MAKKMSDKNQIDRLRQSKRAAEMRKEGIAPDALKRGQHLVSALFLLVLLPAALAKASHGGVTSSPTTTAVEETASATLDKADQALVNQKEATERYEGVAKKTEERLQSQTADVKQYRESVRLLEDEDTGENENDYKDDADQDCACVLDDEPDGEDDDEEEDGELDFVPTAEETKLIAEVDELGLCYSDLCDTSEMNRSPRRGPIHLLGRRRRFGRFMRSRQLAAQRKKNTAKKGIFNKKVHNSCGTVTPKILKLNGKMRKSGGNNPETEKGGCATASAVAWCALGAALGIVFVWAVLPRVPKRCQDKVCCTREMGVARPGPQAPIRHQRFSMVDDIEGDDCNMESEGRESEVKEFTGYDGLKHKAHVNRIGTITMLKDDGMPEAEPLRN